MAVEYIEKNAPLITVAEGSSPELHEVMQEFVGHHLVTPALLAEAKVAHTRRKESAGQKGTDVHALVEKYINYCIEHFNGDPSLLLESDYDEHDFIWRPIEPFIDWAQFEVAYFLAAEQRLYDEENAVAGTADFFYVSNQGELTTGDLKTFPKMWSPDAFIQTGCYARMWRLLTGDQPTKSVVVKMCDPEDERIKKYGNKPFAVYPRYAVKEDEEMFLKRLDIYRYNKNFVSPKD